jgi:hypothetical protein
MNSFWTGFAVVLMAIMISLAFASSNMENKAPATYQTNAELIYETMHKNKLS